MRALFPGGRRVKVRAAVLSEIGLKPPYAKSRPLSVETVELDPPGPGEVLVKIAAAGSAIPISR